MSSDDLIWNLYKTSILTENRADILNFLTKQGASKDIIDTFTKLDKNNRPVFKVEDVKILWNWIKNQQNSVRTIEQNYSNFRKYFSNTPLSQFKSYFDFIQSINAKLREAEYHSRHKVRTDIDVDGLDRNNVIANTDDILIMRGDDEHKCVRYGKNYQFCISRQGSGNIYSKLRMDKGSTFYFIFFKKIPLDDIRHVMVLDINKEGWQWTFADNETRSIKNGWEDIVRLFPVLSEYKQLLTIKPLTQDEQNYHKKLQRFVEYPSIEAFNSFTYQEKSEVLKFGMVIPLDMFKMLDKYLRNEWINVGPRMSEEIFSELTPKERERFLEIRKRDLANNEPKDQYDINIVIDTPELFDKYLKPELEKAKREESDIRSKLTNNTYRGSITIDCKYILPDLSDITVIGDFDCCRNQLISLKGSPKRVIGDFDCIGNQLTNLKYGPEFVSGDYYCTFNLLSNLEGAPKYVGQNFYCYRNRRQLKSLRGSPKYVGQDFECKDNEITSLLGSPIEVGDDYDCTNNRLVSLDGVSAHIGGGLFCNRNSVKFTPEDIKKAMQISQQRLLKKLHSDQKVERLAV